jgi:mono/diheme cytochrome c family protein
MNMVIRSISKFVLISSALLFLVTACDQVTEESTPGGEAAVSSWEAPAEAEQQTNPVRYDVDSVSAGKQLFERHCQQCHGYYGEGNGIVGAVLVDQRPANLLRLAGKQAEGAFAWKIRQGRGQMPAFQGKLSDTEIWQIVNFVASLENEEGSSIP